MFQIGSVGSSIISLVPPILYLMLFFYFTIA